MRFKFDNAGYVCNVLYGCTTDSCVEYTGLVPTQPEQYADMDDWADRAVIQAYKLDSNGNLVYDANKAARLPDENAVSPLAKDFVKDLGIFDLIYPVGSLYMSVNNVSPETLFGGTWEQIEDKFILAAGSTYSAGDESETGVSSEVTVNVPAHKHLTPLLTASNALGIWTGGAKKNVTATNRVGVAYTGVSTSITAPTYYTSEDGATTTKATVPPTLPPYLAVYVWRRVADPIPENYTNFVDSAGDTLLDADAKEFMVEVI